MKKKYTTTNDDSLTKREKEVLVVYAMGKVI
jgi:hypothetical protein